MPDSSAEAPAAAAASPWRTRVVVPLSALVAAMVAGGLTLGFSGDRGGSPDEISAAPTTSPEPVVAEEVEPPDRRLLPNMRSLTPENISLEVSGNDRAIRFDGILANVGPGPLEVVPDEQHPCPPGQRHMAQSIYQDSNENGLFHRRVDRFKTLRPAGCMLFHPEHTHWHLDASARYALTSAADGSVVVEQPKVSFCLRDNEKVPGVDATPRRIVYGECARDRVQGISVGWADVYEANLPGQVLELPRRMPDGVYCLEVDADPLDLLVESDEDDNGAAQAIRVAGNRVRSVSSAACT